MKLLTVLRTLVALLSLGALATAAGGTRLEVAWLRAGRPLDLSTSALRVAVDASYPPLAQIGPSGALEGLEVDLARALAAELGVPLELTNADVGSGLDALVADRFDLIIAGLSYAPELTQDVAFSVPYLEAGPVLVVPAGTDVPDPARWLAGRPIAVEPGSPAAEALDRLAARGLRPIQRPVLEPAEAVTLLESGAADGYAVDRLTALELTAARPGLRVAGPPLASQPLVIAARRPKRGLVLAVDRALHRLQRAGAIAALEARWLGRGRVGCGEPGADCAGPLAVGRQPGAAGASFAPGIAGGR